MTVFFKYSWPRINYKSSIFKINFSLAKIRYYNHLMSLQFTWTEINFAPLTFSVRLFSMSRYRFFPLPVLRASLKKGERGRRARHSREAFTRRKTRQARTSEEEKSDVRREERPLSRSWKRKIGIFLSVCIFTRHFYRIYIFLVWF